LIKYLDSVQELVSLKGKLKGKKLQQMVQVKYGHVSSLFGETLLVQRSHIQEKICE